MKRFLLTAASFAMMLIACQKDEIEGFGTNSQTISVTIPQTNTMSRAVGDGDGAQINRCILEIYRDGQLYGERQVTTVTGNKASFDLRLVTSQTYDFVFWTDCADNGQDKYYDTKDLTQIKAVDYTGNDEGFDAFTATKTFTIKESFAENVTLTRPFGQLNVKTLDLDAIPDDELKPTKVKVAFTAVPASFNVLTGKVSEDMIAVQYEKEVVNGEGYLTMDYLWAPSDESTLADFTMTFYNDMTEITSNDNFKNIPIRRNYRTNVSGNLLTKQGTIEVTIDPIFEGEYPVVVNGALNLSTNKEYSSLQTAINEASDGDEICVWGVIDEDIVVNKKVTIKGGSDGIMTASAEENAVYAKIRTLNVAAGTTATFENIQFFGAKDITNSKTSVLVNNVKEVTFKNCLFAQENVTEEDMRPIETAYKMTGKLTLNNCVVKAGSKNAYFNALGSEGTLEITNSVFEQIVTIDPLIATTQSAGTYLIQENQFMKGVAITALSGASDANGLNAAEKAFTNSIISNGNVFDNEEEKVKVYGSQTFWVNDIAPAIYNKETGTAYESVQEALTDAQNGETVIVSGTTCTETLEVPAGVTLDGNNTTTFTGTLAAAEGATLRNFTVNSATHRCLKITASNVTLDNLNMVYEGSEKRQEGVSFYENVKNVTVKNCHFTGYWKGMYVGNGAENLTIEGCTFESMNPFGMDQWFPTLTVKNNTFTGNGSRSKAIHLTVAKGTEGMEGTTKFQESWPKELKESVYAIMTENTFTSTPYIRISHRKNAQEYYWDYNFLYFSLNDFNNGYLKNAENAFTQPDRYQPSAVDFIEFDSKKNVLHYTLDSRTNQANRGTTYSGHFYNTQGRHFNVFNPAELTKWEVSGSIYVNEDYITSQKPFRSELWTAAKNTTTGEDAYPMLGIANVVEDEGGIYQSTREKAVVRIWGDKGWSAIENVEVTAGWHTVKMVSDGTNVTYYFDGAEIGKLSASPASITIHSIMPQAFHYDYQHTDGNWFAEGYTCDTYFCDIQYKLNK
ncbi:DUF6562 domain-containing protein [Butyricimonas synergistica]|uniref:DUF6562 domain-containing protein n=1 Tax=Butyricimonas synergistica TaxID=544644 RepID=UPI00039AE248|nr:DUF6562 domain-containing protein [Butyricimonas synergistica]